MRYACRKGHHDRCPGRWCACPCHDREAGAVRVGLSVGCLVVLAVVLLLVMFVAGSVVAAALGMGGG